MPPITNKLICKYKIVSVKSDSNNLLLSFNHCSKQTEYNYRSIHKFIKMLALYRTRANQKRIKKNNNRKRRRQNETDDEQNNKKKRRRPNESEDDYISIDDSIEEPISWKNNSRRTSRHNLRSLHQVSAVTSSSDSEYQSDSTESFVPKGASKKEWPVQFIDGFQLKHGIFSYHVHWDGVSEEESSYTQYVDGCQEAICDFWCLELLKELIKSEEKRKQKINVSWPVPKIEQDNHSVVGALNSLMRKCGEVIELNNNDQNNHNNGSRGHHKNKARIQNDKGKMDLDLTYTKTITKKGAKEKYHCIIHTDKAKC